jgi:hypothetical protein
LSHLFSSSLKCPAVCKLDFNIFVFISLAVVEGVVVVVIVGGKVVVVAVGA